MTLTEAKKIAKEINGPSCPFDYRNVWGFFPTDTDSSRPVVFITKDTSSAPLSGIFIDDSQHDGLVNYETGEEVDPSLVLGQAFYESSPDLLVDDTDRNLPIAERLDAVVDQIATLVSERGISLAAMFMVHDVAEDEECSQETVLYRLTALKNYLAKTETKLTVADFCHLIQELYQLE